MIKVLFADQAEQFLPSIVKTWIMRTDLTSAKAADVLVATAIHHGFLRDRERPLLGNTINAWGKSKKTPRWAMQSAMVMLLDDGWRPETHAEWAAFAELFIMTVNVEMLEPVLALLPEGMDKDIASGWICAAVEDAARYQDRKNRR
ncbi:hypothetical protein [Serratia marcescens]|uniref:hypothetical protein n=1 Tax=Serratia marcescens TaxID=615 RepID=UPI0002B8A1C2|nr:hypothetical protein [Serratia marcescens]EMF07170.1 hypothetical protein F518_03441 [Serratia marcescens VGH107]